MLEAGQYVNNSFVTLTYSDENLRMLPGPLGLELATLQLSDLQGFWKRLRTAIAPQRIRYYASGEYGDETWRPHYHAAIFNFGTCVRGRTRRKVGSGRPVWRGCCEQCELVGKAWSLGDVDLGTLEVDSAQYVAGYVTKKMTRRDDPRLMGRDPEFSRMSLRPGIGADAMWEVADVWMKFNLDGREADVPSALRHGSRELPLGRYLRRKLRVMVGRDEKTPEAEVEKIQAELQGVRQAAFDASESFKSGIIKANKGKIASFHARRKIHSRKREM